MPKVLYNIKELIIIEGQHLLKAKGYSNFNVREVAKNCHIAVGTLYNYFSNKEELVAEIIFTHWREILVHIDLLTTSEEPLKEKLIALSQYLDSFFKNYSGVFSDMLESKGPHCPHHQILPRLYEVVETMISIAIEKGEINPFLSGKKLSRILVPTMFYITRVEDLTFEDYYSILKLK